MFTATFQYETTNSVGQLVTRTRTFTNRRSINKVHNWLRQTLLTFYGKYDIDLYVSEIKLSIHQGHRHLWSYRGTRSANHYDNTPFDFQIILSRLNHGDYAGAGVTTYGFAKPATY